MPTTKRSIDIRSLCRGYTEKTVLIMAGLAIAETTPPAVRVQAIEAIWNRGFGKAAQPMTGEGGEGDIQVVIRNIIESVDRRTVTIDHDSGNGVDKLSISNDPRSNK